MLLPARSTKPAKRNKSHYLPTPVSIALTLSDLADWVDGDIVRGEPGLSLTGMAALNEASSGDVSFLGNEKYHSQFVETQAAAVIVGRGVTDGPESVALVAVDNPTLAFSTVVAHFAAIARNFSPGVHAAASVDPSASLNAEKVLVHSGAVIMAGASIGDGSEIGPNVVVGADAVIGEDCHLMANVTIRERCVLGDRVIIQPNTVIGSDGYGYEFKDGKHLKIEQVGIVEIHDDVEVGSNAAIDRARFGKTVIGEGTKIDNLVQIGHNCVIGKHCLIVSQCGISGSTKIGDYVTMAGQSGASGHVTIGDKAVIAGRSGVTTDLEGGQVYSGFPAVPVMEDRKARAMARRLPKLVERLKALEKRSEQES